METVVFAKVVFNQKRVGAREIPSSMDCYDREYGWDAHDFAAYAGGTLVNEYTVDIAALIDGDEVVIKRRYDREEGDDFIILHKSNGRLYDIGAYGIFDTLTNQRLFKPKASEIIDYDGRFVTSFHGYINPDTSVTRIDLDGLMTGVLKEEIISDNYREYSLDRNKCHSQRIQNPSTFLVNGLEYVLKNTKFEDYLLIDNSQILDEKGHILWKGSRTTRYAVAAVGFSEDAIKEAI